MLITAHHLKPTPRRRGVVLLAVLVVIVLLTLAAYQYSDLMLAEYKASVNSHRALQARAIADSGIHYAAAALANQTNVDSILGGNPFTSDTRLANVAIAGDGRGNPGGHFSLIAPNPDDFQSYRNGFTDESGKINPNALMKQDPTGELLYNVLSKLPVPVNGWEDIAASIVDWMDFDSTPRQGGAENEYYSAKNPPYRAKNGPLDSIEELLLVKGIDTDPWILYGDDKNRNGVQDDDETPRSGTFFPGLAAYLTVHSRETNLDADGKVLANLNGDLTSGELYNTLAEDIGEDLAKFVVLYRQYGPATTTGAQQTFGGSIASLVGGKSVGPAGGAGKPGKLADYKPNFTKSTKQKITSMFDLIDTQVSVVTSEKQGNRDVTTTTIYTSPLNDTAKRKELLPKLFEAASIFETAEIPARINVNTAPREVLVAIPELSESEAQTIISTRPALDAQEKPGEIFQTPAWLSTEANLKSATLKKIEKYITTKTQVYRVQAIGTLDTQPPTSARVEAVIDANNGRPRILLWRDLGDWGKGIPPSMR
jgi:type II secretory pathway component PulK